MVTIRLTLRKAEGCKCKLADGNPCCQLFSASMYKSLRDESHALTRDELDLVVMGQLRALVHNDRMTQKTKNKSSEHRACSHINTISFRWSSCVHQHVLFFAHNEPQEAQMHKSQVDGERSGPSKPCAAPPTQYHSTL